MFSRRANSHRRRCLSDKEIVKSFLASIDILSVGTTLQLTFRSVIYTTKMC